MFVNYENKQLVCCDNKVTVTILDDNAKRGRHGPIQEYVKHGERSKAYKEQKAILEILTGKGE